MPNSGPLFLARAVYRRRRLRDAARLLPVVGLLLVLLPALGGGRAGGAGDAVYLFAVWALLIGLAAALAPGLSRSEREGDPEYGPESGPESGPETGPESGPASRPPRAGGKT